MTTRASVERFLAHESLALIGASRGGRSFGNTILKVLTEKGYRVEVVHPHATEVDGRRCFPTLAAVPDPVGGLVLAVPPEPTSALVRAAAERGFRDIWMQQGSESPDAVRFCQEQGINAIHGECILMFADPTGVHRFHRWLWGLLGKLPTASPGATG